MTYGMTFEQFFDRAKIEDAAGAPTLFAHRVGHIELLPGGLIECWNVEDTAGRNGTIGRSRVTAKIIYPLATVVPARTMVSMWFLRNGLVLPRASNLITDGLAGLH